jgi:hypothetical protein
MPAESDTAEPDKWRQHAAEHENVARLRSCSLPHLFGLVCPAKKGVKRSARYRCRRSDTDVNSSAYFWYELGRQHPMEAAND